MSGFASSTAPSSSSSRSVSFPYRLALISMLAFTSKAYDESEKKTLEIGYREGYFADYLPGADEDERGMPNMPLTTDTNRYSDGITSSAYFGVVSPSFVEYTGGLAQTKNRLKYYLDYMHNARWQGLAGYLEGDARQEDALVNYLDQFSREGIERGIEGYFSDLRSVLQNFKDQLFDPTNPGDYRLKHDVLGARFMSDASKMTILSFFGKSPIYNFTNFLADVTRVCNLNIAFVTTETEEIPGSTTKSKNTTFHGTVVTIINPSSLLEPNSTNTSIYNSWIDDYYNMLLSTTNTNANSPDGESISIPPNPSTTFEVYAAMKWNPSNFAIQEGVTYNISAQAIPGAPLESQTWTDGGIRVDADGYSAEYDSLSNCYVALGRCRGYLKMRRRLQTAKWMSLICAIGEFVRPVQEVLPGSEDETRYVPLDESQVQKTLFDVGLGVTDFPARYNGQLICMANDAHNLYWNNKGYIEVTVTRTSWPPNSTTVVYKDLKKPACDSAFAVYETYKNKGNWSRCNPNGGGAGWSLEDVQRGSNISESRNGL